jgi:hypothetical protein
MNTTIKWSVLGVLLAVVAIVLYTFIDSAWARENNASIVLTIAFFATTSAAIVCGFNAADSSNTIHHEH